MMHNIHLYLWPFSYDIAGIFPGEGGYVIPIQFI